MKRLGKLLVPIAVTLVLSGCGFARIQVICTADDAAECLEFRSARDNSCNGPSYRRIYATNKSISCNNNDCDIYASININGEKQGDQPGNGDEFALGSKLYLVEDDESTNLGCRHRQAPSAPLAYDRLYYSVGDACRVKDMPCDLADNNRVVDKPPKEVFCARECSFGGNCEFYKLNNSIPQEQTVSMELYKFFGEALVVGDPGKLTSGGLLGSLRGMGSMCEREDIQVAGGRLTNNALNACRFAFSPNRTFTVPERVEAQFDQNWATRTVGVSFTLSDPPRVFDPAPRITHEIIKDGNKELKFEPITSMEYTDHSVLVSGYGGSCLLLEYDGG